MIKAGDKLVAISDKFVTFRNRNNYDLKKYLTKGKTYTVVDIFTHSLWIICDDLERVFSIDTIMCCFISYSDWLALEREKQIKTLLDD
jgi:hypothetical protein